MKKSLFYLLWFWRMKMQGEYALMVDLQGTKLKKEEMRLLLNEKVGGIILFSRNFENEKQLKKLIQSVRDLDRPRLIIAVDQEGGRVQRFKTAPFSVLPPARALGALWDEDKSLSKRAAQALGAVLGHELKRFDVDLVFAPVLDLDYGESQVIGTRAFHAQPEAVSVLAKALMKGLKNTGVSHCGKHFPGHGFVRADSHTQLPVDSRSWVALSPDLKPYQSLRLNALMAAHVIYPAVSQKTAVFSKTWHEKLRKDLRFRGAVFTDDLSMKGASGAGEMPSRIEAAWAAGNDMLLICNDFFAAQTVLEKWQPSAREDDSERLRRLKNLFSIQNDTFLEYSQNLKFLKDLGLIPF